VRRALRASLLGIDLDRSHEFEREIAGGCEGIKPGWVRVNFNYFISEPVFTYIVDAVVLVARDGWRLLTDYVFDPATGLWRHRRGLVEPPLRPERVNYEADGGMGYPHHDDRAAESDLATYLTEAIALFAASGNEGASDADPPSGALSEDFEHLRWFDLPAQCLTTS